jgi:recyclin-1
VRLSLIPSHTVLTPSSVARILVKHLKKQIVSIEGGFQLISDLNAYHDFVSTLRQPNVTAYFTSLKIVGEIFIVDAPKDLGQLVRDVSRYDGTVSADDLYEFGQSSFPLSYEGELMRRDKIVQQRADWKVIEKQVEKQLFGLKLADDCIIS